MKIWLISILVVLLQCGLYLSADCPKHRFARRPSRRGVEDRKNYRLGLSKDDEENANIVLTIANTGDKTEEQVNVEAPDLEFVAKSGEKFTFTLAARGKKKLKKLKESEKRKRAFIRVVVNHGAENQDVRVSEVEIGEFACTFPIAQGPCKKMEGPCDKFYKAFLKRRKNAPKNSQAGMLSLRVPHSSDWNMAVGFDKAVESFKLMQPAELVSSDCNQIFNFKKKDQNRRKPRRGLRLKYLMNFKEGETAPPIAYISYGSGECNTSCGVKPVCPGTTDTPTITDGPPEPPTEGPIEAFDAVDAELYDDSEYHASDW